MVHQRNKSLNTSQPISPLPSPLLRFQALQHLLHGCVDLLLDTLNSLTHTLLNLGNVQPFGESFASLLLQNQRHTDTAMYRGGRCTLMHTHTHAHTHMYMTNAHVQMHRQTDTAALYPEVKLLPEELMECCTAGRNLTRQRARLLQTHRRRHRQRHRHTHTDRGTDTDTDTDTTRIQRHSMSTAPNKTTCFHFERQHNTITHAHIHAHRQTLSSPSLLDRLKSDSVTGGPPSRDSCWSKESRGKQGEGGGGGGGGGEQ